MRKAKAVFCEGYEQYSHSLSYVVQAGPFVFLSGVIGVDQDGKTLPTPKEEFHAAFRMINDLLAAAGATTADIIALDTFHVVNDDGFLANAIIFDEVKSHYLSSPMPTLTAVGVSSLARSGARAEVRVTAYCP